ncbi:uncharacterized protein Nmnat [Chelonus insularis]|uniref:uncharacterized protein Nmnat n=1 Tax=Chelonus insularis TaxID=460826 RepID=UPI00158AA49E|nr:uncharacterized protein LOC118066935 [Chelonus insularis]
MAPTRIILMSCGSYNPPTNMHLRMFEIARDHLHRMGTHVVVGGVISPVHDSYGKKELASAEHRVAMLKAALQNNEWIKVSTWETRQNTWSKTKTSLTYHQNILNSVLQNSNDIKNNVDTQDLEWIPENVKNGSDKTPIQIKLLCGADLLESFAVPNLWAEEDIDAILGQHGLVVITREGSNPNKFIYDSDLLSRHMHNIYIVTEWICNEVSSTKIRRALKRGESVKYLIQDAVIDYIHNCGLYDVKTTSSTTKLSLSSTNSDNYLHIDSKYNSAFLTPSPSDVTMASPSPVEIISIDIAESLIQKNIQNSPKSRLIINSDDTARMRDKFMNIISENDNKISNVGIKSIYPGQAKQIIATETGESQIFCEVGLHETSTSVPNNFTNGTERDNNSTECEVNDKAEKCVEEIDGNISSSILLVNETVEQIPSNVISPADDSGEVKSVESVVFNCDKKISSVQYIEVKATISPPLSVPEAETSKDDSQRKEISQTIDQPRRSLTNSSSKNLDIDGKYLKSVRSTRKNMKQLHTLSEQVVPMMESDNKSSEEKEEQVEDIKNLERSKSVKENNSQHKNFQGSLESINARKPKKMLSKKSKSFEYIKGDLLVKEIKQIDFSDKPSVDQSPSSTTIEKIEIPDVDDTQIGDEYCSVCCNSSPVDVDSPECEICSSTHFQNIEPIPTEPQCELCEICGDIAMDLDVVASSRPESEEQLEARLFAGSRHVPLNLKKRKITSGVNMDGRIFDIADEDADCEDNGEIQIPSIDKNERAPSTSIEEYSDDDSTLDDVEFEIENCGLDTETNQSTATVTIQKDDTSYEKKLEDISNIEDKTDPKKITRGSSLINRSVSKPDSKKRYSSVDDLPISKKTVKSISKEAIEVKEQIKVAGSVDNIRMTKTNKSSNRLRKSADDVGKSIKEEEKLEESKQLLTRQNEKSSRLEPDTIKFIIGKHGLKIISDRETAL